MLLQPESLEAGFTLKTIPDKRNNDFVFSDVSCNVPGGKEILTRVNGHARAGDLVALMGSSG